RMLPAGTKAVIRKAAWPRPQLFHRLQQAGGVAEGEMLRVFNCGIGMVIALARDQVASASMLLRREGELVYEIGTIEQASGAGPECLIV
ncbi:MAG TPA: AIR synthase-related protein, partial [Burkholderiales bacterium]|nr:AIR synthase-related protein [Burkholderiales bacterium]